MAAATPRTQDPPPPAYRLHLLGHPALRLGAEPVDGPLSATFVREALLPSLHRACREHRGLGISAPQLGVSLRVSLVTLERGGPLVALLNPVITFRSPEMQTGTEGCLSIPGFFTSVQRHRQIEVDYLDPRGDPHHATLGGVAARVVQHELDHLDGKLIVDGCSRQQRRQAERLVAKAQERAS